MSDYSQDELEILKETNDELGFADEETRPDVVLAWPRYLTIANTSKCNLECPMCFKQLDDFSNMSLPDMEWRFFEKLADEVFPHLRWVNLSVVGEPLISKNIFRELELFRRFGVRSDVTTNGMPLARRGLLEALLPVCRSLTISFDGATKETFEYLRRKARWETVLENIRAFDQERRKLPPESRPFFHMTHVYQKANLEEPVGLVEIAHQLGVDLLSIQHVYAHLSEQKDVSPFEHRELANRMLGQARARAAELGLAIRFPEPFDLSDGVPDQPFVAPSPAWLVSETAKPLRTRPFRADDRPPAGPLEVAFEGRRIESNRDLVESREQSIWLPRSFDYGVPQLGESLIPPELEKPNGCRYPWREAFVSWNGMVGPCCSPALFDAGKMGSLRKTSFAQIWNGPVYQRLRSSIREGKTYMFCRHCHVVDPEDPEAYRLT